MNSTLPRITHFLIVALEIVLIAGSFLLVNYYSLAGAYQFPAVELYSGEGWSIIPQSTMLLLLAVLLIKYGNTTETFIETWKRNGLLLLFLVISLASLSWSVFFPATLYKLFFLFFSTIIGSYIAVRYKLTGLFDILTWVAIIFTTLSFLIIIFLPIGTMYNPPYAGSWRGIFWHRNHMGSLMAYFNMILLVGVLFGSTFRKRMVSFLFYLLSAVLVFGSRSATGAIVFLVLNVSTLLGYLWLRWRAYIKLWHYYLIGTLSLVAFLAFITNVGFFFGLLGRSVSMTGRVPLWQDLITNVWLECPILGYGYGALWMQESFRELMMKNQGWTKFPVFFSDNGFLDILLNLGLLGFLPFIGIFLAMGIRSFRNILSTYSWIDLVPLLSFVYLFVGNIAYSFFLEVDQFVWMIFIMMLFVTTHRDQHISFA